MTREEILTEEYLRQVGCKDNAGVKKNYVENIESGAENYILESMDEYAKQQSIAWEQWKRKTWFWTGTGWVLHSKPERFQEEITDEELYTLFLEQSKM